MQRQPGTQYTCTVANKIFLKFTKQSAAGQLNAANMFTSTTTKGL